LLAAVVVALAIAWIAFVPAADWIATHDVGQVTGPLRTLRLQTARDAARGRLLTLGAGLFAAGALIFTARNFTLSRRTFQLTEQGQVTDRYTKAIEQPGSDKFAVRIGGIYALERIAHDSSRDHPTVIEVLAAFIREYSHDLMPRSVPSPDSPEQVARPDVQAAITVIGRRDAISDRERVDLTRANLAGADLTSANLGRAKLVGANLTDADLTNGDIARTSLDLTRTNLADTLFFLGWRIEDSARRSADLTDADLTDADLTDADLTGAKFTGAKLTGAKLVGADLTGADLTGADLTGAKLTQAKFFGDADANGSDLTDARWPLDAAVPEGWQLDTGSRLLNRASTAPGSQDVATKEAPTIP
jgi:hypothetical protein